MKKLITIGVVILLSLAVTAFADDPREMNQPDTGTLIYEASLAKGPVAKGMPSSYIEEVGKDVGTVLYESQLAFDADFAARGKTGMAAGGVGAEKPVDENTLIWENLFGPKPSLE